MKYIRMITLGVFIVTLVAWLASVFVFSRGADKDAPVITADKDSVKVSIEDGEKGLKKGLSALDKQDGDLTDKILIGKQSKFIKKGVSQVQYLVFDANNNVGTYTRTVEFKDYRSPEFKLDKPLVYNVSDPVKILDRLHVVDCIRGDISDKIKIVSSDVDSSKPGVYSMGIEASNQYGDLISAKLPVRIVDSVSSMELSSYFVTIDKGDDFDARSYVVSSSGGVSTDSNVDVNTPGIYSVVFSDGTGESCMIVCVRD